MTSDAFSSFANSALLPIGLILLGLAALANFGTLRMPQFTGWLAAFRGLRQHDSEAEGEYSPSTAVLLSSAALYGAAAAAGAALVVGVGGPAVIGWAWLLVFVLSPLAVAETILARTGTPGDDRGASGSLSERLRRSPSGPLRALGFGLFAALVACACSFMGSAHGVAIHDAASIVLPNETSTLLLGCAIVSTALAIAGASRAGTLTGWLAAAGIIALAGAALWGAISNFGQGLSAIPRGFADAMNGTSGIPPFMGASPGPLAALVLSGLALPLLASMGLGGALHAGARARTTGVQARAAMLGLVVFALLTTLIGVSAQATSSYFQPMPATADVMDLRVYRVIPETASQRAETDRLFTGLLRVTEGEMRDRGPILATDTGPIEVDRFTFDGEPADVALRYQEGRLVSMLQPQEQGLLDEVPIEQWRSLAVSGQMLTGGLEAWLAGLNRGAGNDSASRLALMGLLLLLVSGAAAWGMALARSAPVVIPAAGKALLAALPAASIALSSLPTLSPWLQAIGGLAAALVAIFSGLALLLHAREAGRLLR